MPPKASRRTALFAGLSLALVLAAPMARGAPADPAAARIEAFDNALIETMKAGPSLGAQGRYRKLLPVVEATFDLPLMTRVAVGAPWTTMSDADQKALVKGFTRLTAANYAHNFSSFSGERFELDPNVQTRGPDKIVQTRLIPAHDAPVSLAYRMRQSAGDWKVIDVFYGAISQLTTRRSDFAAPLAAGGAKGLLAHLDAVSDNLLK
jgi:phospholipid transport system substrate-binding protein